jgi:hypothetical protein
VITAPMARASSSIPSRGREQAALAAVDLREEVLFVAADLVRSREQEHEQRATIDDRLGPVTETEEGVEGARHSTGRELLDLEVAFSRGALGRPGSEEHGPAEVELARPPEDVTLVEEDPARADEGRDALRGGSGIGDHHQIANEEAGEGHGGEAPRHGQAPIVRGCGQEEDRLRAPGATPRQAPLGVAGDDQMPDVGEGGVGALDRRHALGAVARPGERDQERGGAVGQAVPGVRHEVGRGDRLHAAAQPARQGPLQQLSDERRGSGAGEDHAPIGGSQGLAEKGEEDGPLGLDAGEGGAPEIQLPEDLPHRVAGAQRCEGVLVELGEDGGHGKTLQGSSSRGMPAEGALL